MNESVFFFLISTLSLVYPLYDFEKLKKSFDLKSVLLIYVVKNLFSRLILNILLKYKSTFAPKYNQNYFNLFQVTCQLRYYLVFKYCMF